MTDHSDLIAELQGRAVSYRLGGPSSEHTALLLDQAAIALSSQSLSLLEAREEIERLKGLVAGIRAIPQEPAGGPKVGQKSLFDALEAAYIRGASWCAELGGRHTFGELRKAAFDYADKEQPDLLAANTAPGAVLEAVLAAYEAETRSLPLGAANREKGDSTYNWRMSVIRDLRELASRLTNTSLER